MLRKSKRKLVAILCVLLVGALITPALATPTAAAKAGSFGADRFAARCKTMPCGIPCQAGCPKQPLSSNWTDEQKAVWEKAQADWEAACQVYLGKLVDAGVLTQGELDSYNRVQTRQKIVAGIDMMQWTMAQVIAYRKALAETGAGRKTALEAFETDGLLTQDQVSALIVVSSRDIDFSKWTLEQLGELKSALAGGGENRLRIIQDFINKGLLTQGEADVLIGQEISRAGKARGLTDEQKDVVRTAAEARQKAWKEINKTLQDAGLLDRSAQNRDGKQKDKPFTDGGKWHKRK